MKKVEEVLGELSFNELIRLKKDLDNGAIEVRKVLQQRIRYREFLHEHHCHTCVAEIDPYSKHTFTMVFGSQDFRKKASFCALDCLQYFLRQLPAQPKISIPKEE
ncbi:MAG TPA: hypothetical protein VJK52_05745 [Candidatus Nanoarchaeia archaeon]|nr:hypothetical protein [Candidatus Nanoarchaeia archaeon]